MENIQQAAKPSAMMNEAPMNHLTLSDRLKSYKRTPGSFLVMLLVVLSAVATIAALVFLILYILVNGIPYINADLFSWTYTSENCSVIPAAINTVIMAGISLLLAVPVGIGSAIYLVEYAKKGNKLVKVIRVTAETLTGIPSIVYGLFGMLFFVTALKWKFSILAGAFTLAIMILPVILRTTEEALLSVPDSYREGSFGLGAGKLRTIFKIVLPAAIITVLIFWFATRNMNFHLEENVSYSLWEVLPYMVVLLGALIGINVFVVLISGIVISLIVGVSMGHIALSEMFQVVGNGVTSMYDITVISIIVACIVSLVKEHGGIQFILNLIKSKINGRRGAEFGIALLAFFVDACTANNTVAIVMTGPIAKEISEEFDVDPRRSASLLDMFTSVGQGIIPYGAQLLSAATLTGLTPLQIIPNLYYPLLMGVCGVLAIIFRPQSKKLQ